MKYFSKGILLMPQGKQVMLGVGAASLALAGLFTSVGGMEVVTNLAVQAQNVIAQNPKSLTIVFPSRSDSTDFQRNGNAS
jgi:phosphonate transport system substrate-binding protein